MWKCHKCGKPVYFAERKQSLGYDWHPECLRCEECGKRLNPGLHAEHKGVPYCHVPCYGALFGPQLFGHGTRVESHRSFGDKQAQQQQQLRAAGGGGPALPRDHIESKLRVYNQYQGCNGSSHEIRSREVNERLVLEGALRICWGVQGMIHLKEDDDQRTVVTVRKRNSCRYNLSGDGRPAAAEQQQPDDDEEEDARNDDCYYHDPEPADEADNDDDDGFDRNGTEPATFNTATYIKSAAVVGSDSTDISLTDSMSYDTCTGMAGSLLHLADDRTSAGSSATSSPGHQQPAEVGAPVAASVVRSQTMPGTVGEIRRLQWDELDELLQVERRVDVARPPYQTMPAQPMSASTTSIGSSSVASSSSRTLTADGERCPLLSDDGGGTATVSAASGDSSDSTASTATPASVAASSISSSTSSSSSTVTTSTSTTSSSDEYMTPSSTLRNTDFDLFRQQMNEEYRTNTEQLQSLADGTLRSNQPIDPSRINDSLKLYSDQQQLQQQPLMSRSFCGAEPALRSSAAAVPYKTLRVPGAPSRRIAAAAAAATDANSWLQRGLNRSSSGPNWFDANGSSDESTLKPSTIRRQQQELHQQRTGNDLRSTTATVASSCSMATTTTNGATTTGSSAITTPSSETSCTLISDCVGGETTPTTLTPTATDCSHTNCQQQQNCSDDGVVVLRRPKLGSTAIKRRSGKRRSHAKLKRRCSINGHFYNRETSFFTPPHGSQMSVWVTSLVSTADVIQLLLEKYKVDSGPANFALYVVRDNGEQKRLRDDEYPLLTRIMMGPHEEVARLFLMDAQSTTEISSDVAQYLNLSEMECRSIVDRFNAEQEREEHKIRDKYAELKSRIVQRMESLKVRL